MEYRNITSKFPYESLNLEQQHFPKQFPFSAMVPRYLCDLCACTCTVENIVDIVRQQINTVSVPYFVVV